MKEHVETILLPSFCRSISQTFETMAFMPLTCGQPESKTDGQPSGEISGTIGLSGEDICGSLSLIFPRDVVIKIFKSMMMSDDEPQNDHELRDMVGELTNMAAGGAKSELQAKNINFVIGLPTVVVGNNHYLNCPEIATSRIVKLSTQAGDFYMQLAMT